MQDELYRRTEGILYGYYNNEKRIRAIKNEIQSTVQRINTIQSMLKDVNIDIDDLSKGISYEGDRVQNCNVTSGVEKELMRQTEKLLNQLRYSVQKKWKLKTRLMNIEIESQRIGRMIEELPEEKVKIAELKYKNKKSLREIALIMNYGSHHSVKTRKDEIVEYVAQNIAV